MADKRFDEFSAIGATLADTDLVLIQDVSDTTDRAEGTTKKATRANIVLTDAEVQVAQAKVVSTKGQIQVATANDTVALLAVGSNTQVLTADSAEASGVKWAAAGAGGGGLSTPYTTSAYIQNDTNALTRGALQITLRADSTITAIKFRAEPGNFSLNDGSNHFTVDAKFVSSAGGTIAAASSMIVTPLTTDDATFSGDLPNQLFDLGTLQNTTRSAGDMIVLYMPKTGSPNSLANAGMGFIVEYTET